MASPAGCCVRFVGIPDLPTGWTYPSALLAEPPSDLAGEIEGDGLAPAARLAVYRHHVLRSLTDALLATFPVVARLVGEGFFRYAADRYVRAEPPAGPCLFEYGAGFGGFLAGFSACAPYPFLGDVARLEWAMNAAIHAAEAAPLAPAALAGVPAEAIPRLDRALLANIFGLTAAEAGLAQELLSGDPLARVAGRLGVSENTIKTQLQSIYEKTGTHRQAQLVKLLMGLGSQEASGV